MKGVTVLGIDLAKSPTLARSPPGPTPRLNFFDLKVILVRTNLTCKSK